MVMKDEIRVRQLISDGERRIKILSAMDIELAAKSPYVDAVLEFLKHNPDYYQKALSRIDSEKDNLGKIMATIDCLKTIAV
jgi:hypothetical protein